MYRREPTAVSRGPRLLAFNLKNMLMLSRCATQNSRIVYQAAGVGGPRIGVALAFLAGAFGSLLADGSIAFESALDGSACCSSVCAGFSASAAASGAPSADGSSTAASAPGGLGSRFASSAVCAGFRPVISPRAIVVNSMKIHGGRHGSYGMRLSKGGLL